MGYASSNVLGFDPVYPIGMPKRTDHYVDDLIGFYEVDVHYQLADVKNVIPRRVYEKEEIGEDGLKYVKADSTKQLDWKYKGSFTTFLNTTDIKQLRKYHGEASCTVKSGYVFE